MINQVTISPCINCPVPCSYCFGPREGGAFMKVHTPQDIIQWVHENQNGQKEMGITFRRKEPLIPGAHFNKMALPIFKKNSLKASRVQIAVQRNLRLQKEDLCLSTVILMSHSSPIWTTTSSSTTFTFVSPWTTAFCDRFSRAWGSNEDSDAMSLDYSVLYARVKRQRLSVLGVLSVNRNKWEPAGSLKLTFNHLNKK